MKVKLFYKTENNEFFGTSKEMTIKQARALAKELLSNTNIITEIYLKQFNIWGWKRIKTLYKRERLK